MKLKEICSYLNSVIPLSFQEGYDNSGLQIGMTDQEITGALLTLDVTEDVIREAVNTGCNLIISHHPVIFSGIKRISGESACERIIFSAIRNNMAIYSAHTNLDVLNEGVSMKMAEKLGLKNVKVLNPIKNKLMKLVTFIPDSHYHQVTESIFEAGAGVIGKYDRCGYSVSGIGSFRAGENTNPYVGEKNIMHYEPEKRFETIFLAHDKDKIINALISSHPYEEPAFDIYSLENDYFGAGQGSLGELKEELSVDEFIELLSNIFDARGIRYSGFGGMIKVVALCGGSGSFLLETAVASGADAFVTGDVKYHAFQEADKRILLVDCGHYETEKFSVEILSELIIKKFPKFAVRFSKTNTNPINYR